MSVTVQNGKYCKYDIVYKIYWLLEWIEKHSMEWYKMEWYKIEMYKMECMSTII